MISADILLKSHFFYTVADAAPHSEALGILWGLKFWDLRGVVDKIELPFSLAGILRLILSEKAWIW